MSSFYAEGYLKDLPTWLEFQCLLQYTLVIFAHIYSVIINNIILNIKCRTLYSCIKFSLCLRRIFLFQNIKI